MERSSLRVQLPAMVGAPDVGPTFLSFASTTVTPVEAIEPSASAAPRAFAALPTTDAGTVSGRPLAGASPAPRRTTWRRP